MLPSRSLPPNMTPKTTTMSERPAVLHEFLPSDYFRRQSHADIFPDSDASRPLEVDIGCGDGAFTSALAAAHPERDFLAVERLLGRVRKVSSKAKRLGLTNLKVLRLETAYTVGWLLPENGVCRIHLLFPDPWPKDKHEARRVVTPELCEGISKALAPDGEWIFKSDHAIYFQERLEVIRATKLFKEIPWDEEAVYPITTFEQQWLDAGKTINRVRLVKA